LDGKNYNSKELIKNMRTQTGQKDIIQGGLTRLEKVRPEISELFKTTKANSKWIALPFLESSFNEKAISKVNAAGAWQIMPWIGKRLLPYSKGNIDARFNIYLSTLAAIQILKQNIRITKSDEISIIAYNSGLRNYFKTKKKLKKEYIDYIEYLENADSKIFGFASRNFLMEYFALQESINPEKIIKNTKKSRVKFYISRCKTRPKKVIKLISANDPLANKRNNHYIKKSKVYPPGQIYITEINLPNKYYRKVKNTEIKRRAPIEWVKNTTLKPCSII
jgi:membrane-bound lytic murein transglycosylase D